MPKRAVEPLLVRHIFWQGILRTEGYHGSVSPYAPIAADLGLTVDQVKGGLGNLRHQKGMVGMYEPGPGVRLYHLTGEGLQYARRLSAHDTQLSSRVGAAL